MMRVDCIMFSHSPIPEPSSFNGRNEMLRRRKGGRKERKKEFLAKDQRPTKSIETSDSTSSCGKEVEQTTPTRSHSINMYEQGHESSSPVALGFAFLSFCLCLSSVDNRTRMVSSRTRLLVAQCGWCGSSIYIVRGILLVATGKQKLAMPLYYAKWHD